MLSPLLIARSRLIDHINTLRNNAVTNFFIGIGIAAIGVMILFWAIVQIGAVQFDDTHNIDTARVIALVMFPKLSITIFIQIFSYFFLAMYRSNQQEIRYFQNEITTIDSFAAVLIATNNNNPALKIVLTALSKNERNRVIKKGEKPIVATDEAELIHAMSVLSRVKEGSNLLDK
jgi:chromate transport protein ChrA